MTGSKLALAVAVGLFLALSGWQSRTFMVWSEETMVYPSVATGVVAAPSNEGDTFRLEPSCTGADEPLIGFSDGRPRMFACALDRKWPVMIAPYLGGALYWPLALLAPLHHFNVFKLRLIGLLLGVASMLLTFEVVRRLRGGRLAALVALSMAVTPAFVAVHSTLVHFEALPWALLMAAVLLLLRAPGLFSGASSTGGRALVLASFLAGLACLANLKTVLFLVPMIAVALRLGVRLRPLRLLERLAALIAFGLPFLVALPVWFAPSGGYADKASSAPRALLRNVLDPARVVPYTRDLLLFWSDLGEFLSRPIGESAPNRIATLLAAGALGFTCVTMVQALRRKQGCPVTTATGACIVVHLLVVSLLYESFPANFAPVHALFAVAGAVTLDAILTGFEARGARTRSLAVLALCWLAPFAVSVVLVIRAMVNARVPANVGALRSMVAYLDEKQGEGVLVVNTHVMLTGVVESLSNERVRTLQAQNYLNGCSRGRDGSGREACLERRFSQLLTLRPEVLRFVVPTDPKTFGGDGLWLGGYLVAAAQTRGRAIVLEQTFFTPAGTPVLAVYRAEAP